MEGDDLHEAQEDGAGEETFADLLSLELESRQCSSAAWPFARDGTGSLPLPASLHVAPSTPIAAISSSASWFSSPLILLFLHLRTY